MSQELSQKAQQVMSELSTQESLAIIQMFVPHIAAETKRLLLSDHYFLASVTESVTRLQDSSKKITESLKANTHWVEFADKNSICPYKWTIRFLSFEEATTEHMRNEPYLPLPLKEQVPDLSLENVGSCYTVFTREGNALTRTAGSEFEPVFKKLDQLIIDKADELYYYGADTIILRFPDDKLEEQQAFADKARQAREQFRAANQAAAESDLATALEETKDMSAEETHPRDSEKDSDQ